MKLLIFFLSLNLVGCINKTPLIPKDETSESERNSTLIAFVGKKIYVKEMQQDSNSLDGKFKAKYKILQRVYGKYAKDVIEFEAYDHYGFPEFSYYDNVLLFVRKNKEKYYHVKYQFYDVYPTEDGNWAGIYHEFSGFDAPPPTKKISFAKEVYRPLSLINNDGELVKLKYSSPYFKIIGDKAYPVYGYSIEELFTIKKNGILKRRGYFGKGNENWADSSFRIEPVEIKFDSVH